MAPKLMQKQNFVAQGEGGVISYSWQDSLVGQGYVTYYLVQAEGAPRLIRQSNISSRVTYLTVTNTTTFVLGSPIIKPLELEGDAMFCFEVVSGATDGESLKADIQRKPIGGAFASIAYNTINFTAASGVGKMLLFITVPKTQLNIGDELELILTWTGTFTISVDPASTTYIPARLDLPFKVEI